MIHPAARATDDAIYTCRSRGGSRKSDTLQIPWDEYRGGRRFGDGDSETSWSRVEELEEMQRDVVRQEAGSETEGEGLQNSGQTS